MKSLSDQNIDQALHLLGKRLELADAPRLELVVCGGLGLLALGLIRRSTQDLDVLGRFDEIFPGVVDMRPLPDYLLQAAEDVRAALDLPQNWINAGPADQLQAGLPEGFASRLVRKDYGSKLTLYFAGRFDQIHFKLYAACDQGPGKHVQDLMALKPTTEEIATASQWVLQQDDSSEFRSTYLDMLRKLGYGNI